MTNPEITTEQMIKHYEGIRADSDWHPDCPICEAIRAALLERNALKAERNFLAELRSEVLALGGTEYLKSLKAEVERARPLLEAVEKADVTNLLDDSLSPVWRDTEAILLAALSYRGAK